MNPTLISGYGHYYSIDWGNKPTDLIRQSKKISREDRHDDLNENKDGGAGDSGGASSSGTSNYGASDSSSGGTGGAGSTNGASGFRDRHSEHIQAIPVERLELIQNRVNAMMLHTSQILLYMMNLIYEAINTMSSELDSLGSNSDSDLDSATDSKK